MTIGEIIKKYREEHNLSQRQFAEKCNISMLEKDKNPKTNEPIIPSLPALKRIADSMETSVNDLINMTDDMYVYLSDNSELTNNKIELTKTSIQLDASNELPDFIYKFKDLSDEKQREVIAFIEFKLAQQYNENNNQDIVYGQAIAKGGDSIKTAVSREDADRAAKLVDQIVKEREEKEKKRAD